MSRSPTFRITSGRARLWTGGTDPWHFGVFPRTGDSNAAGGAVQRVVLLNPEEDRLCMVCEMVLDEDGNIGRAKFYEAVMRSHARLTYTQVARILVDGDKELRRRYKALVPHLENLYSVYRNLRRAREERGAIDFETQESRIVFGAGRKIDTIIPVVRNDAHRLIEECMIAANMATARFLAKKKVPHLLRVHEVRRRSVWPICVPSLGRSA